MAIANTNIFDGSSQSSKDIEVNVVREPGLKRQLKARHMQMIAIGKKQFPYIYLIIKS